MKIKTLDLPAVGIWARDCELISLVDDRRSGFALKYRKESDDTCWVLKCKIMPGYKIIGEEFSRSGYLINIPANGSFFEIINSPWLNELLATASQMNTNLKHYILQFYDETVEIIAAEFIFEKI